MLTIEVLTVDKYCERNCAHCAYAIKDRIIGQVADADPQVQETFSFLEGILAKKNKKYYLGNGITSLPMLQIKHPTLIKKVGFQINYGEITSGVDDLSARIQGFLKERSIETKVIAFAIYPKSHLLNEIDAELFLSLIHDLKSWFLTSRGKLMMISCDHDFGIKSDLEEVLDQILESDRLYMLGTIKRVCVSPARGEEKAFRFTDRVSKTYRTCYEANLSPAEFKNVVWMNHRVISPIFVKEKSDAMMLEIVKRFMPQNDQEISLLIYPRGVMLTHSTLTVNNPIFWVSHRDFRENFAKAEESLRISDIIRRIFVQNMLLFIEARQEGIRDFNQMKQYFEENRWKVS